MLRQFSVVDVSVEMDHVCMDEIEKVQLQRIALDILDNAFI